MNKIEKQIKKIFELTQDEPFMGGKLLNLRVTDDVVYINSKTRMDANMIFTLLEEIGGMVDFLSVRGDVLVIRYKNIPEEKMKNIYPETKEKNTVSIKNLDFSVNLTTL